MSYRIEIQILIGICKQILQTNITHQTKRWLDKVILP